MFRGYIKVQETCQTCGHDNGQYRADDAGPYFTILLVGHLVIGPMLIFPFIWQAPIVLVLGTTLPLIAVATLLLLPLVKGAVIGVQWGMKAKRLLAPPSAVESPPIRSEDPVLGDPVLGDPVLSDARPPSGRAGL